MWFVLVISSLFELGFTAFMKLSEGFRNKKYTLLCILSSVCSIGLLSVATTELPLGVAYAVWTGLGTVLITLFGIAVFKESKDPLKLFFLGVVMAGVIGLRLVG